MARGQQKLQSQAKNLKKQQDAKKQMNHDGKAAAAKALLYQCSVCKVISTAFGLVLLDVIIFADSNARSENVSSTFRKQTSEITFASGITRKRRKCRRRRVVVVGLKKNV